MATGPATQIADVIVPEIFAPYVQIQTAQKSALVQSGAVINSPELSSELNGGGLTFNAPFFNDLDDDADNVATDAAADKYTAGSADSTPFKITAGNEIAVSMTRTASWSASKLTALLAGADPMQAIGNRVSNYWTRRVQDIFVATMTGVFADNDAAPVGTEHVQGDLTFDVSGVGYTPGVTDFSAEAFIDATQTMGDARTRLSMIMVHSIVKSRMEKNNLIDFIPDSQGNATIPTFRGKLVIEDDRMPNTAGVYESWIFGQGALGLGSGLLPNSVSTFMHEDAGNGIGQEVLYNRMRWVMHPVGHSYVGTPANGGPSNAATANNLANAGSWQRVYPERKQIPVARLITREHA